MDYSKETDAIHLQDLITNLRKEISFNITRPSSYVVHVSAMGILPPDSDIATIKSIHAETE